MSEHCATYSCNKQLGTVKSIEKLPRLYGAGRWSTRWRRLLRRRVLLLGNETMPQNLKTDLEYIYMRMIYIYISLYKIQYTIIHVLYANVTSKRLQCDELCRAMSGRTLATCNVKTQDVPVRAVLGSKHRHNSTGACDALNLLPCMCCIGCFRAHALRCFSKLN